MERSFSTAWNELSAEITSIQKVAAGDLEILYDGDRAFDVWKTLIASARDSICLYTYYFQQKGLGEDLITLLEQKARRGVSVRIIASRYAQLGAALPVAIRLRRAGCRIVLTGMIGWPYPGRKNRIGRNRITASVPEGLFVGVRKRTQKGRRFIDFSLHVKMLVVDRETAIIGGRNINDNYFRTWEDADVYLTGPAARSLASRFDREYASLGGQTFFDPPVPGRGKDEPGIPVRIILSNPWEHSYPTLDAVIRAVSLSRKTIDIMTQYVIPPEPLTRALIEAARRGVRVTVVTNSRISGKAVAAALCWYISANWYERLMDAGIHVCEWYGIGKPSYLHTKLFLFDRNILAVGSFNLSIRSAYLESEILCFLEDRRCLNEASEFFEQALTGGCREVTTEDLRSLSIATRLIRRIARGMAIYY